MSLRTDVTSYFASNLSNVRKHFGNKNNSHSGSCGAKVITSNSGSDVFVSSNKHSKNK